MTGESPAKTVGPRHTGGGKKRGRQDAEEQAVDEALEAQADLPIADYDQLPAREISERIKRLGPIELRKVRDYEVANKHRRSIVAEIEKRLAA
jgi:hypothetical protein